MQAKQYNPKLIALLRRKLSEGYKQIARGRSPPVGGKRVKNILVFFHPEKRVCVWEQLEHPDTRRVTTLEREHTLGKFIQYSTVRKMSLGKERKLARLAKK